MIQIPGVESIRPGAAGTSDAKVIVVAATGYFEQSFRIQSSRRA